MSAACRLDASGVTPVANSEVKKKLGFIDVQRFSREMARRRADGLLDLAWRRLRGGRIDRAGNGSYPGWITRRMGRGAECALDKGHPGRPFRQAPAGGSVVKRFEIVLHP